MRRLALALALVAGAVGALTTVVRVRGAGADATFRVDAIFDTAKGLIPGQLVKIAGARAGVVEDVVLTRAYKARIQMRVEQRFAPFRASAHCEIQPQALIGENFVQCEPGSGRPLVGRGGQAPTVPVERTTVPLSLTDLFQIWAVPVRQRLSIVIGTLGSGIAGRGSDVNAIFHRANPTLAQARRAIRVLSAERHRLARLVADSDAVLSRLARHRAGVRGFIDHAARVTQRTSRKRAELADAVRRLPGLLDAARPALRELDELAGAGTPVLADLRASAPGINRLLADLGPFAHAAQPALHRVGTTVDRARRTARTAAPLVGQLAGFARAANPTGRLLDELFSSLRERGFVEGLLTFVYRFGASAARYDRTSHLLPVEFVVSRCSAYAAQPVEGCQATYRSTTGTARTGRRRARQTGVVNRLAPLTPSPQAPPRRGPRVAPERGVPEAVRPVVDALTKPGGAPPTQAVRDLLDYLLK